MKRHAMVCQPVARMDVGLLLNQEEEPGYSPTWQDIAAVAKAAEGVGLASLWLVDHFLWHGDPWGRDGDATQRRDHGVWEAWTTLAALAAITDKVRLGTLVTCTRYRNPALLAKMAHTADAICGGRLVLGLGAGDNSAEHEEFGYPTDRPVDHFAEALAIIAPLLRKGEVEFNGQHYSARARLLPRAARSGGPPILIGSLATGPRILGLVARYADVWNAWPAWGRGVDLVALLAAVDAACHSSGRDPLTLRRTVMVPVALEGPMVGRRGVFSGDDEIVRHLEVLDENGIDEVQVRLFPTTPDAIERFARIALKFG